MTQGPALILASTSRYRRELLSRLKLPFEVRSPDVDETPRAGELPAALAQRLALAKAQAVSTQYRDAVVIGSDQVADLDGMPIGKPGTHERAVEQLRAMSGRSVIFQTAVAVVCGASGFSGTALVPARVSFRTLSDGEIEHYPRTEQPYDCAGSAKAETLGIALLDAIESIDPTALVGLPLIQTCALLRQAGIDPLAGPTRP
jgi:septum formation protein